MRHRDETMQIRRMRKRAAGLLLAALLLMPGVLLAVKRVRSLQGLVVGLENIL